MINSGLCYWKAGLPDSKAKILSILALLSEKKTQEGYNKGNINCESYTECKC
jgi:hypothetical protein